MIIRGFIPIKHNGETIGNVFFDEQNRVQYTITNLRITSDVVSKELHSLIVNDIIDHFNIHAQIAPVMKRAIPKNQE